MMVEFGRSSLIDKARAQPDKVAQTLAKLRTDGPAATLDAVRAKLNAPVALGYSAVGRVIEVGSGAPGLAVGDRVVTNQPHAEFVTAMATTIARVPDKVPDDAAAFTVVGAVGASRHSPDRAHLGRIGRGDRPWASSASSPRNSSTRRARASSASIPIPPAARSPNRSASPLALTPIPSPPPPSSRVRPVSMRCSSRPQTSSRALIGQAAAMCRARGRIVLTGIAPLNLSRDDFFKKELTFQVSAAYGPRSLRSRL